MSKNLKLLSILLLTFLCAGIISAAELTTGVYKFGKNKKGYLFLPENFKPGPHNKFILFMHGRGAAAGKPGNFGSKEFEKFRQLCSEKGYVVAVPPLVSTWFNPQAEKNVDTMLNQLAVDLQMDLSRFHVVGCSMGAMSALVYAGRNSERVITLTDIFGVTDMKTFCQGKYKENIKAAYGGSYDEKKPLYESRSPINYVSVLKNIPILILHGAADVSVPPVHSQQLYDAVTQAGGKQIKLIIVPKIPHSNVIIKTRENMVFEFMEAHK